MKTKNSNHSIDDEPDDAISPSYRVDNGKVHHRHTGRRKVIVVPQHGGARPGAGRKPAAEPIERHTITILKSDAVFLRKFDKHLSAAIRKLIAQQKAKR